MSRGRRQGAPLVGALLVGALLAAGLSAAPLAAAQTTDDAALVEAERLNGEAQELFGRKRLEEAEERLHQALRIRLRILAARDPLVTELVRGVGIVRRERGFGDDFEALRDYVRSITPSASAPDGMDLGLVLHRLAEGHADGWRHPEAEPLVRDALVARERSRGPEDPVTLESVALLARVLVGRSRPIEAEPVARRVLESREHALGPDDPALVPDLELLGGILLDLGQTGAAEPLLRRGLAIRRAAAGPQDPSTTYLLTLLGRLHVVRGELKDAEAALGQALLIREASLAPDHLNVVQSRQNLGLLRQLQGRYEEAIRLYLDALGALERVAPDHPGLANVLSNLGVLYTEQRQYDEAEGVLRRALGLWKERLGPSHERVATSLNNLAAALRLQRRFEEAEPLIREALDIFSATLGADHPSVALLRSNLANIRVAQGDLDGAEILLRQALEGFERGLGPAHRDVAAVLENLAWVERDRGRLDEAERIQRRAVAIWETSHGALHPILGHGLAELAGLVEASGRLAEARALYERARCVDLAARQGGLDDVAERGLAGGSRPALERYADLLARVVREADAPATAQLAAADAFVVAEQLRGVTVGRALTRAATRLETSDPAAAELVRVAQDLRVRRERVRRDLAGESGKLGRERDAEGLERLYGQLRELDGELAATVARLVAVLPAYGDLTVPEPIDPAAAGRLLRPGEALLAYLALPDRLLAWVVKAGRPLGFREIALDRRTLEALVTRVRASVDTSRWSRSPERFPPVDVEGAHALYRSLVMPFEAELAGVGDLLVVPDEVLVPLPFGVLLTHATGEAHRALAALHESGVDEAPSAVQRHAELPWLIKAHAVSVLPAATSLRALRGAGRVRVAAREAFIGFGDPALGGQGGQRGGTMVLLSASPPEVIAELRRLPALPGTRLELRSVAQALGAEPARALFLGAEATESAVRELNRSGRLGQARILAFATHGLLAGDLGLAQPALVLTPPASPGPLDDGLLTLEEILGLSLPSTELVVLSACNTAAADGSGESLAGLARAFFFVGAPSMLVSHWQVEDRATQILMTEAFREVAGADAPGRAEALRRGMLRVMNQGSRPGQAYLAHPLSWAPFSLVGEGGGL